MLGPRQYEYEGWNRQTDLDIWEFVLQELDGSLRQAIRVEGLLCSLCLQVLRCLQQGKTGQGHAVPDVISYASKNSRCKGRHCRRQQQLGFMLDRSVCIAGGS